MFDESLSFEIIVRLNRTFRRSLGQTSSNLAAIFNEFCELNGISAYPCSFGVNSIFPK